MEEMFTKKFKFVCREENFMILNLFDVSLHKATKKNIIVE